LKQRVLKLPNRVLVASAALLGGVGVVLATHQQRASEVWADLTAVPVSCLAAAGLFVLCQLGFQTLRLWAIMPQGATPTLGRTAYAFSIGEWFNIFAPARAGDALKVVLIHRGAGKSPISLPKATGVVLADKLVDAASLIVLCTATGLLTLVGAEARAKRPPLGLAVSAAGVLLLLLLGVRWARPEWFGWLIRLRRELVRGLSALTRPVKLLGSIASSFGAWAAEIVAVRVLCGGLGFSPSPAEIVLALVVLNLAISVPVSVANVGVYEAALAFGLGQAGLPLPSAVAIATLHHALELFGTNLVAAGCWLAVRRGGGADPVSDPQSAIVGETGSAT